MTAMKNHDQDQTGSVFGTLAPEPDTARQVVQEMVQAGLLDEVMAKVADGDLRLTGPGGFLPEMVKAALERGLDVELSDHLGYHRGDRAGQGYNGCGPEG